MPARPRGRNIRAHLQISISSQLSSTKRARSPCGGAWNGMTAWSRQLDSVPTS